MESLIIFWRQHTLLFCIIIGTVIMTMWWLKFQKKLNMRWYVAPLLSIAHFVVGVIVMKFWALLEVGFVWEEAATMRAFGALFILPPLYFLGAKLTKRDIALVMDISAVCDIIGLFIGRVNCLMAGCCEGTLIATNGTERWPLREIEMMYCFIFLVYFWQQIYKRKTHGMVCPIMAFSYGMLRFILEWFREEYTGELGVFHLAHIWSLLAMVAGAVALYMVKQKAKSDAKVGKTQQGGKG